VQNSVFSVLALRIAGTIAVIIFVVSGAWGITQSTWQVVLPYAVAGSLMILFVTYIVSHLILQSRVQLVINELDNLANKRFFDHEYLEVKKRDELDFILNRLNDTSDTIEREIQRLKRIENYRKEFIGDLSHELKTPIFAIQGFIETLLNGALEDPEVNREFLQKAMRNVNRLITLTNDLMEIAKLETGELKVNPVVVTLRTMITEIVETLYYKAEREQISIEIQEIDPSMAVFADRNQIRQVMLNLVENAIKYNRPGGAVVIGIRPTPQTAKKITLFVQDTGIGIEAKHLPRVTERFYRIDKSRSRDKGGTGLGLAIVKHIIEAHHEQLTVESTPNVGSTFSFTLQNAASVSG
jgi:two-component system, OmpR family, phosphate regulon sensor histidine kinase PhoR